MSDFSITVVVPVLNRPQNVNTCVSSFLQTVADKNAKMVFITSASCEAEINEINRVANNNPKVAIHIAPDDVVSWAKRINLGIDLSETPWVLCGADDVRFHEGWFDAAAKSAEGFSGIIGTNDMGHPAVIAGNHTTHPIVSKEYVLTKGTMDELGKFCHEGYIHNYVDVEFVATARARGNYTHSHECKIEHLHPSWNKAGWDPVYQRGQAGLNHDRALWIARSAKFGIK
jgi:hypothetical protein